MSSIDLSLHPLRTQAKPTRSRSASLQTGSKRSKSSKKSARDEESDDEIEIMSPPKMVRGYLSSQGVCMDLVTSQCQCMLKLQHQI